MKLNKLIMILISSIITACGGGADKSQMVLPEPIVKVGWNVKLTTPYSSTEIFSEGESSSTVNENAVLKYANSVGPNTSEYRDMLSNAGLHITITNFNGSSEVYYVFRVTSGILIKHG